MHEPQHYRGIIPDLHLSDAFWILLSCIAGVGISCTAIWVQSLISATSMLVLTNSNKFVVIMLELYVMPDKSRLTHMQIAGALLTIIATGIYAMARDAEEAAKKQALNLGTEAE